MEKESNKKCPYCGEMINVKAKKCIYCGEWLEEKEEIKKVVCPVCGESIDENLDICPFCHEKTKTIVSQVNEEKSEKADGLKTTLKNSCFYKYFIHGMKRCVNFKEKCSKKEYLFLLMFSVMIDFIFIGFGWWDSAFVLSELTMLFLLLTNVASTIRRGHTVGLAGWKITVCIMAVPFYLLGIWDLVACLIHGYSFSFSTRHIIMLITVPLIPLVVSSIVKMCKDDSKEKAKLNIIDALLFFVFAASILCLFV